MFLHIPYSGGPVIRCASEVVSEWAKLDVPDWKRMRLVYDQAGAGLQGPAADGAVLGAGEEELVVD